MYVIVPTTEVKKQRDHKRKVPIPRFTPQTTGVELKQNQEPESKLKCSLSHVGGRKLFISNIITAFQVVSWQKTGIRGWSWILNPSTEN